MSAAGSLQAGLRECADQRRYYGEKLLADLIAHYRSSFYVSLRQFWLIFWIYSLHGSDECTRPEQLTTSVRSTSGLRT